VLPTLCPFWLRLQLKYCKTPPRRNEKQVKSQDKLQMTAYLTTVQGNISTTSYSKLHLAPTESLRAQPEVFLIGNQFHTHYILRIQLLPL